VLVELEFDGEVVEEGLVGRLRIMRGPFKAACGIGATILVAEEAMITWGIGAREFL